MATHTERPPGSPPPANRPDYGAGQSLTGFDTRALRLAIVLVVLSGLLGAALLVFQRQQVLVEGRRLTDVFAQLMDEQTSRTLQTLDQRLELIALEVGAMERSGTFSDTNMRTRLDTQLVHLPFVMSLAVLDAQGQVRFDSATSGDRAGQAGEDHFRTYQTRPGAGFYLGPPRRVGQPPEWVLYAARPIHDDAGRLTGVVVASVHARYFDRLWQSLALESGSAVSLLRTDGTLMLRSPHDDTAIGRNFRDDPLFTQHLPTRSSGSFSQSSPVDGAPRLAAYRTLARYPDLLVLVSRTLDVVLAPWNQLARMVIGGWFVASALVIALSIYIGRESAQRRHAENTTRQMAQRLSIASDAAGIVLWDWDVHTGHWFATPTFYTALGYPPQDGPIAFDLWFPLIHPDDKAVAQAAVDTIRNVANARYAYEIRLRHADGGYRWVQTNGQVIARDAGGRPTQLIGVRIDVTERKLADIERRQVLERITDGFVALDAQWRFTYVNRQAAEMLESDPRSLIGKNMWDAFPPLPDETFHLACQQAMTDQEPAWLEAYSPTLGRWIEDHIYPSPEGISIYFRDITQRKTAEIELRRAKEEAENIIVNANVMIVRLNSDGQITMFNQAAQDLTGYSFADLAGRNWFEVLVPRQRFPQVWAEFEHLLANREPRHFENPILTKTGQERLISWRNGAIRDRDQVVGTLSFGIDVTTRRQAELALAESKEQFEVLAQHSLQGIVLMRKAQVIYVNPAICTIAGRSAAELTSSSVAQLRQWVHPQDNAALIERRRRALQGEHAADLIEMRVLHASGQWRWIQAATRAITLGGDDVLMAMVVDIHERKVAEDALRDSEERFRSAFESSGIGISLAAMDGRWLMVNPALCAIVGYSGEALLQLRYDDITHPDDREEDRRLTQELFAGDSAGFQMEKRLMHLDGHTVWVNLTVALAHSADGLPTHTVAHIEDISRRKQLELDLRGNKARLTATLDALPDLMFEVDQQGRYLDYHSPRTELLVHAPQDLIGRRVSDTMPPAAASAVIAGLQEAMAHGHAEGQLIELMLADGLHIFELSMALKASQPDEEPRFIVLSRDITDRTRTQHALRDSEELMRQMAESISQMFWLFDLQENRYLYISPASERVLGYTAADLLADPRTWRRNVHALDRDRYKAELIGLLKTGTYDTEIRLWQPDGSLHWLRVRAYPILGPDQTPYRLAGVTEDITERKTLEQRENQEHDVLQFLSSGRPMAEILDKFVAAYEAMLPGARGSVLLMDPDGAHLRHGGAPHLPPAYCLAIDGIAVGAVAGSCGTAAFIGDTVMVSDTATDPRWVDYRALAAAHQLQACWSVPIKGAQGQVLGTFAFYFDHVRSATAAELATIERGAQLASQAIERHLAAQALLESEERYRTLVEWSPEGIAAHQNGLIIYANPAAAMIMGAGSAAELIGKPMIDFVHPDDRADLQNNVDRILTLGESTPLTERLYVKLDGTVIDVETKGGPITINGAPAVQVIVRDVTARKKEQSALRESRQQLRVLSSRVLATQETERRRVAHELHDELGQALTAIKINLQADDRLAKGARNGLFAENIRIVEEALQHVRGLALALRPSMLDDLGLSPALRWLTEQTATRNPLQVQLHAPASLGRLDPDLETAVFRIVQEALTNIVRHAQASHVQVRVTVIDLDTLLVQVQDDGVGFDVPAMRQRATEGNSMGVLGMQERASLVGAELSIVSSSGQGCTVTLRCPVRAAAPAA